MTIWFFIDSIRWTAERLAGVNTPSLGGSVGGTEAMTVGLCRSLLQWGHKVTLWTTKLDEPGLYDGLLWRSVEKSLRWTLLNEYSPDVFIAVRRPEVFSLPEVQGLKMPRVLWAGDVLEKQQGYIPYLTNVDTVIYVSEWHRRQWEAVYPPLSSQFYSWITPVALNEEWITPGLNDRQTFIYSSQPDRGLVPLLQMWPRIRKVLPEAKLLIAGYTADVSRIKILADRLITQTNKEVGGIEVVRSANKTDYFKHLARCRLLLYPGVHFEETNGHVCSEAMASGVIPLVSDLGALSETVPEEAGLRFSGDANSSNYQDHFISEVIRLASPEADLEVAERQKVGRKHVLPRCTYKYISDLWDTRLRELTGDLMVSSW
jgi:glycosyltransferase involved in cell wall biosynthesis